jgi:hypothetical protein
MANQTPVTKRGRQEPPPELQDRPEQNLTYDAIVRGERRGESADTDEEDYDEVQPPMNAQASLELDSDERAAREAAAEVKRRERSAR